MRTITNYLLICGLLGLASCNQGSDFTAQNAKKSPTPVAPVTGPNNESNGDGNGTPQLPESNNGTVGDCKKDGVTKVKLLTSKIPNNTAQQWVEYEVRLEDCDGKSIPVKDRPILFDIDATISPMGNNIGYAISNLPGDKDFQNSGTLKFQSNKDLFGKVGPNYAFWMTDPITIDASSALHLTVKMGGFYIQSLSDPGLLEFKVQSFLRFGDAVPVQQEIIVSN